MTRTETPSSYWRLSSFYFFYFVALGAFIPYWSLYLKNLGFIASEIGQLFAAIMATKIIAPYIWGWVADHSNQRLRVIRIAACLMVIFFCGIFWKQHFWWVFTIMFIYSFFWNAMLPQMEVITLNHLGEQHHRYGNIRLWGSIGFIVMVLCLGYFLDQHSESIIPWVLLSCYIAIACASLTIKDHQGVSASGKPAASILQLIKQPSVIALMLGCFLMAASHAPYYTFFSIYLESAHYSKSAVGFLWSLGVAAEIFIFVLTGRLMTRYTLRQLLLLCFLLTVLRWILIALFVEQIPVLILAQLLHAFSFGLFHVVMIALVRTIFTGKLHGRGQALYTTVSFGLGGAVGALGSGYLWQHAGAVTTFLAAATVAFLGLLIIQRGYKELNRHKAKQSAVAVSQSVGEL